MSIERGGIFRHLSWPAMGATTPWSGTAWKAGRRRRFSKTFTLMS